MGKHGGKERHRGRIWERRVVVLVFALVGCIFSSSGAQDLIWVQTSDPSVWADMAYGVAIDETGIYVVGWDYTPGDWQWRIEKRNLSNGVLIWQQTSNPSRGDDWAYRVSADGTGIYVVGRDYALGNAQWRIEKRDLNTGALIWQQTFNSGAGRDAAMAVAADGTGIYVVGYIEGGAGDYKWRIEKRDLSTGNILWQQISNPSVFEDMALGVAADGSGLYVVGYYSVGGQDYGWWLEKRDLRTGALIWRRNSNRGGVDDVAMDVAVDGTALYVVGYSEVGSGDYVWLIEKRDLNTGNILWQKTSNPTTGNDLAYGVAVDGTGVYVVGHYEVAVGDYGWRIEKRDLSTGNLIWERTSDPSVWWDVASDVAVDSTGVYVIGYDAAPGSDQWRIEKRCKTLVDTSVTIHGSTLIANATGATYQWLSCENGFAPIAGATDSIYTPRVSGSYAVEVTQNGCTDTSGCYFVTVTGLGTPEGTAAVPVHIYPNPSRGKLIIIGGGDNPLCYQVKDPSGRLVTKGSLTTPESMLDLSRQPAGTYTITVNPCGSMAGETHTVVILKE